MKHVFLPATFAAVISLAAISSAIADTKATDSTSAVLSDVQCTSLWSTVHGTGSGDLAMDKAQPYVKDFKKADVNGDTKLSAAEWKDACSKGWVTANASGGTPMPANKPGGETSDRTPGGATERSPGAGSTGAAGTGAGQTPEGTSDRTPEK